MRLLNGVRDATHSTWAYTVSEGRDFRGYRLACLPANRYDAILEEVGTVVFISRDKRSNAVECLEWF